MGARGPKPSTELSETPSVEYMKRPSPPAELSSRQAEEWESVVSRLPADWFPAETHTMLVQYCKHKSAAIMVSSLIAEMESRDHAATEGEEKPDAEAYFDLESYDKLLKMQERESRAITALARSLRFTLQATYDKSMKKGSAAPKPWE